MKAYINLLRDIVTNGIDLKDDRTGVGRRRVFSRQTRFDLSGNKLPVVTTRKINPRVFIYETLFFIKGYFNTKYLHENDVHIWDHWAVSEKTVDGFLQKMVDKEKLTPDQAASAKDQLDKNVYGDIGPMYGWLWRHWPVSNMNIPTEAIRRSFEDMPTDLVATLTEAWDNLPEEEQIKTPLKKYILTHYYSALDQINELILNLKEDPFSSRHVVTCFTPEYTPIPGYTPDENVLFAKGCLMPCHNLFQVFVEDEGKDKLQLSLNVNIRSWDVPVGGPFNIAGYGLLAHMLAHCTGMEAKELIVNSGDTHIYLNQLPDVLIQMSREPYASPTVKLNPDKTDMFQIEGEDIEILNYEHHEAIKYPVAI